VCNEQNVALQPFNLYDDALQTKNNVEITLAASTAVSVMKFILFTKFEFFGIKFLYFIGGETIALASVLPSATRQWKNHDLIEHPHSFHGVQIFIEILCRFPCSLEHASPNLLLVRNIDTTLTLNDFSGGSQSVRSMKIRGTGYTIRCSRTRGS
jgi:hypothetical protein